MKAISESPYRRTYWGCHRDCWWSVYDLNVMFSEHGLQKRIQRTERVCQVLFQQGRISSVWDHCEIVLFSKTNFVKQQMYSVEQNTHQEIFVATSYCFLKNLTLPRNQIHFSTICPILVTSILQHVRSTHWLWSVICSSLCSVSSGSAKSISQTHFFLISASFSGLPWFQCSSQNTGESIGKLSRFDPNLHRLWFGHIGFSAFFWPRTIQFWSFSMSVCVFVCVFVREREKVRGQTKTSWVILVVCSHRIRPKTIHLDWMIYSSSVTLLFWLMEIKGDFLIQTCMTKETTGAQFHFVLSLFLWHRRILMWPSTLLFPWRCNITWMSLPGDSRICLGSCLFCNAFS